MKALKIELNLIGMSNTDLAEHLNITSGAISFWLDGKNRPKAVHVKKMIDLGIDKAAALNPSKEIEV